MSLDSLAWEASSRWHACDDFRPSPLLACVSHRRRKADLVLGWELTDVRVMRRRAEIHLEMLLLEDTQNPQTTIIRKNESRLTDMTYRYLPGRSGLPADAVWNNVVENRPINTGRRFPHQCYSEYVFKAIAAMPFAIRWFVCHSPGRSFCF